MITSGKDNDVDNDKEQSSTWYSQTHINFTCIHEEIKIHTLSFKKPTVKVTSEFLGLDET